MTKKFKLLLVTLLSLIFIVGCGNSSGEEEVKYYDDDFMTALADGLTSRWQYTDSTSDQISEKLYTTALTREYDEVKDFRNEKFEDSKLQELAISYINELENGLEVAKTFGADSFIDNWITHTNNRTKLLVEINNLNEIPVKDKETLNELLAQGKDVVTSQRNDNKIDELISTIHFAKNEEESDEFLSTYEAVVENNTDLTFNTFGLIGSLLDADGVKIEDFYANTNNWAPGQKVKFSFMTDKSFEKIDLHKDFVEIE